MAFIYLHTKNTSYVMHCLPSGKIEHCYYGRRLSEVENAPHLKESQILETPHSIVYDKYFGRETLDTMSLEYSEGGKGDFSEPAISVYAQTGYINDFKYKTHRFYEGKKQHKDLPSAIPYDAQCTTLEVILEDTANALELIMYYHSFYDTDSITRYVELINKGDKPVKIDKIMSLQLAIDNEGYQLRSFGGAWTREMQQSVQPIVSGVYKVDSKVGVSSNRHNPFIMLTSNDCTEHTGVCYGFNLIYSGNHLETVEVTPYDKIRVLTGLNNFAFDYYLGPNETFITPEAVMTYSYTGMNGLSRNMHQFVNAHIVPKRFQNTERPVLLNNWEATYFDFNRETLLALADEAKEVGVELFVLDDGWFGARNDDTSSLGDWHANETKLGGSLKSLAEAVNAREMDFGLWVEPEMISGKSELYKKHPEWVLGKENDKLSEGRNQYLLDLSNDEVCDYLIEILTDVLTSAPIRYIKWDMNRNFSDAYSKQLSVDRQGEVYHRYTLGFYRVVKAITERFPDVLFEGCAAGGNRFDLGVLCYMPQIWASDNTDAYERMSIQKGLSYGYPQNTYGAHVSTCPNHQTGRSIGLETRFNVAAFGVLGYELNLLQLSQGEKNVIKEQIAYYKTHRKLLQYGQLYRLSGEGRQTTVMISNAKQAILGQYQGLQMPNPVKQKLKSHYLSDAIYYHVQTREQWVEMRMFEQCGDTLCKLPSDEWWLYGDHFNYAGIKLKEQTIALNLKDQAYLAGDFSSRLYLINQ